MRNATFSQLYREKASLQTVTENFIEYVFLRYQLAFKLSDFDADVCMQKTATRLQIDVSIVRHYLLTLGYDLKTGEKKDE